MTFKKLAEYFSRLEETSSRLKTTEILAALLKEARKEEVDQICFLALGRLAPAYKGKEFNLAEKLLVKVLARAFNKNPKEIWDKYKQTGDLGETAEFFNQRKSAKPLSVKSVYQRLYKVATEFGQGSVERKIEQMAALITDLDALSTRYVVRIPLGRLRLGFSELTIMDALSWLLVGNKNRRKEIETAYNVRADIGLIAREAKANEAGLKKIKPKLGIPIMPALCQRLPNAEEIIKKMGKVAVEPKYDGARLAVHFARGKMVQFFSRNLENVTSMFPDLTEALPQEVKVEEAIFDGEVIGFDRKTGKLLPFQETIKRKRKYGITEKAKEIPLKYFVFDLLLKNGKNLLQTSFSERRKLLEKVIVPGSKTIFLSPQLVTEKAEELKRFHNEQIKKGLEGVVVKKWLAPYDPGRRGYNWVKFKQEKIGKRGGGLRDTLDCLVMGYYQGRGKRANFGIGAFLAGIRESEKTEKFLTVSKIGTGLSDEQWREIHRQVEQVKVTRQPRQYVVNKNLIPDVWAAPKLVVEIEADNLTLSPIHTAGLALRFPRLIRFRDDKTASQTTTLTEARKLYAQQK